MYYKLSPQILLRGWNGIKYAIYNTKLKNVQGLSDRQFELLSMCNGIINLENIFISKNHRALINDMVDCGIIYECKYGDQIDDNQFYKYYDNKFIRSAHWSITGKCNYKCKHCFMSAPNAKFGEINTADCIKIIDGLYDCGVMQVSLTGGEPFVRKDFFDIVDYILSKGIHISQVYTNGSFITDKLLDEFCKRGIKPEFSLSFDGVGYHDWMRGIKGAEEKAVRALSLLNKMGFPTSVEMSLNKMNIDSIEDTVNLLSSLNVSGLKISPTEESGLWKNEKGKYTLTTEELYKAFLSYIPVYLNAGSPISILLGGFFGCEKGSKNYVVPCMKYDGTDAMKCKYICGCSRFNVYISAGGRLLPCIPMSGFDMESTMPDVLEIGFKNAINDNHYSQLTQTTLGEFLARNDKCNNCEYSLMCGGGCRAEAIITSGDYWGCDKSICLLFKGGYLKMIEDAVNSSNSV